MIVLFPYLEKVTHQLEHSDESHCGEKELHFCSEEHSCKICDFIFSSIDEPSACCREIKANSLVVSPDFFTVKFFVSSYSKLNYSLRAPPFFNS